MGYLSNDDVIAIIRRFGNLYSGRDRKTFFALIPEGIRSKSQETPTPADQFNLDVNWLNTLTQKTTQNHIPLVIWLDAINISRGIIEDNEAFIDEKIALIKANQDWALNKPHANVPNQNMWDELTTGKTRAASAGGVYTIDRRNQQFKVRRSLKAPQPNDKLNFPPLLVLYGRNTSEIEQFTDVTLSRYVLPKLQKAAPEENKFSISRGSSATTIRISLDNKKFDSGYSEEDYIEDIKYDFQGQHFNNSKDEFAKAFKQDRTTRIIATYISVHAMADLKKYVKFWFQFWNNFPFNNSIFVDREKPFQSILPVLELSVLSSGGLLRFSPFRKNLCDKIPEIVELHSGKGVFECLSADDAIKSEDVDTWMTGDKNSLFAHLSVVKKISLENQLANVVEPKALSMRDWARGAAPILSDYGIN